MPRDGTLREGSLINFMQNVRPLPAAVPGPIKKEELVHICGAAAIVLRDKNGHITAINYKKTGERAVSDKHDLKAWEDYIAGGGR